MLCHILHAYNGRVSRPYGYVSESGDLMAERRPYGKSCIRIGHDFVGTAERRMWESNGDVATLD
jgi:hypothetical protein